MPKKGYKQTEEHRKTNIGRIRTPEARRRYSKAKMGERNPAWKGGIISFNLSIRSLFQSRQWRSDVFMRDNFTCQKCGDSGGMNLRAHHIESLKKIIKENSLKTIKDALECEKLWNINNGITLCKKCHSLLHKQI